MSFQIYSTLTFFSGLSHVHPARTWLDVMNSSRPVSAKVEVSTFEQDFKRHGLNMFALCSYPSFKEVLSGVECAERPEWFQDVIESDAPSQMQISTAQRKSSNSIQIVLE